MNKDRTVTVSPYKVCLYSALISLFCTALLLFIGFFVHNWFSTPLHTQFIPNADSGFCALLSVAPNDKFFMTGNDALAVLIDHYSSTVNVLLGIIALVVSIYFVVLRLSSKINLDNDIHDQLSSETFQVKLKNIINADIMGMKNDFQNQVISEAYSDAMDKAVENEKNIEDLVMQVENLKGLMASELKIFEPPGSTTKNKKPQVKIKKANPVGKKKTRK